MDLTGLSAKSKIVLESIVMAHYIRTSLKEVAELSETAQKKLGIRGDMPVYIGTCLGCGELLMSTNFAFTQDKQMRYCHKHIFTPHIKDIW
jgi:hypothetical protein